MKTLVTGGAGFIGCNLAQALLARGDRVVIADDLSSGYRENLALVPRATFIEGDITEPGVAERAVGDVEVVFHLAASVGNQRSITDPLRDAEINVMGTLRLLQACRAAGVRKVVVSSSAGIFGELKTLPIAEDHPVEPESPYGATKLCEEKLALVYSKIFGVEAVALRYFNVFGPLQRFDAYGNVIPIFAFKMLRAEPITVFGDGEQTRDFVNVRDVVQANLRAGDARGVSGAFNIGSNTRISINGLVAAMRRASGLEPEVRQGPPRAGDVRDSLADTRAAREAFGFEPTVALEAGLEEYFRWARTEVRR
jgi:UDP-glucose 4-epimerase